MFSRPDSGEAAILVHLTFPHLCTGDLAEFQTLASSAGVRVLAKLTGVSQRPNPKFFIGAGKVEQLSDLVQSTGAELVLVDHALSPAQERNLEEVLQCRVLDRTRLILDIFAQRARTHEGKLQVELAQLTHLSTRLIRGWTHLGRQKGGIGLRGPGETQLESDRRLIRRRIKVIKQRLEKVRTQRHQGRRARAQVPLPTVTCVGYTNAGKSSLFNRLCGGNAFVADQLFATLDPTLRRVIIPQFGRAIVADTVGFIRHLPHDLVDAFRATLEETQAANLLLHVVDVSDEHCQDTIDAVNDVLNQVGAGDVMPLFVFNKIDLLDHCPARVVHDAHGKVSQVWLSAKTGEGIDLLLQAIAECLGGQVAHCCLLLTQDEFDVRTLLHEEKSVLQESFDALGRCRLEVKVPRSFFDDKGGK
jgi:GTPase